MRQILPLNRKFYETFTIWQRDCFAEGPKTRQMRQFARTGLSLANRAGGLCNGKKPQGFPCGFLNGCASYEYEESAEDEGSARSLCLILDRCGRCFCHDDGLAVGAAIPRHHNLFALAGDDDGFQPAAFFLHGRLLRVSAMSGVVLTDALLLQAITAGI